MVKKTSKKENGFIRGVVTLTSYLINSKRAREIEKQLSEAQNIAPNLYEKLINELKSICENRVVVKHNLVVLTGRSVLAGILLGETTYTGVLNYGALGTSSTAVASSDTQLGTEVFRKLFARRTRTNATCNLDYFFSKADTNGTYQEFGLFIDGTSTANSGVLFNRVLTGGWTKSSAEALTVSIQLNINDA